LGVGEKERGGNYLLDLGGKKRGGKALLQGNRPTRFRTCLSDKAEKRGKDALPEGQNDRGRILRRKGRKGRPSHKPLRTDGTRTGESDLNVIVDE